MGLSSNSSISSQLPFNVNCILVGGKFYCLRKMAPRKRVYYKRRSTRHYSVESKFFTVALQQGTTSSVDVVPAITSEGKRKVAHLTISGSWGGSAQGILWALMYIPQGVSVPAFNLNNGGSILEPNQYVMSTGTFDADAGPMRISSRLTRNLNSGDKVVLLLTPLSTGSAPGTINGIVRYAISY